MTAIEEYTMSGAGIPWLATHASMARVCSRVRTRAYIFIDVTRL
jgi:hypothetical protein